MDFQLFHGDCLAVMPKLPESSVDMILTDLPYGQTASRWDAPLPFKDLWQNYWRLLKPNAVIALTSSQPFTTDLIASQREHFKYCWIWKKSRPSGFVHARNMPLKDYEEICIFSKGTISHSARSSQRMPYYPQGVETLPNPKQIGLKTHSDSALGRRPSHREYTQSEGSFPRQILEFPSEGQTLHPTQKPVALLEYLIKTYTKSGAVVLDSCCGSGTTGIACRNLSRRFIGIEKKRSYFEITKQRMSEGADEISSITPQAIGAQKTHLIRSSRQEAKIQAAIAEARRSNLRITKSLIAEMVGISRQHISQRYAYLFAS